MKTKELAEQKNVNRLLKFRTMVVDFMKENNIPYSIILCETGKYYTTIKIGNCELKISNHQSELNIYQKEQILTNENR